MGEFILNGRNYGGSTITPNPSDTPTDSLDSIKIDNTTYEIQGGGGGGSSLIIDAQRYSLEEQVIGIWTDGKPLYQKTFNVGNLMLTTPNTWYPTIISISANNIEQVKGIVQAVSDVGTVWDNIGLATNINDYVQVNSSRNSGGIAINFLTLIYTKTTDTAGSGGYQAYGFSPIIYSDTEREVGVWMDGKPLYQKTINCGYLPNNSTISIDHNISNLDMYCHSKIFVFNDVGSSTELCYTAGANDDMGYYLTPTKINIVTKSDRTTWRAYATIQYTKTTDVAGSGEYNTLAIPNVHYSTDEQVIGTWIDGKPIYETTLPITQAVSLTANSWTKTQFDKDVKENILKATIILTAVLIDNLQAGFVDNKVALNCPRNVSVAANSGYLVLQYTKTT